MSFAPLPGIAVTWNQVVPVAPDTFAFYALKRRVSGAATWTRLAVIADLGTTSYTDYTPQSGVLYEYTVTWTSNRAGALFESAEDNIVAASVAFIGVFLHDATVGGAYALSSYVELRGNALTIEPLQARALVTVWGRAQPTVVIGSSKYRHVTWHSVSQDVDAPELWQGLSALQDAQADGAPLCFRYGRMADRLFTNMSKLARDAPPYEYLVTLELDEVFFTEAA